MKIGRIVVEGGRNFYTDKARHCEGGTVEAISFYSLLDRDCFAPLRCAEIATLYFVPLAMTGTPILSVHIEGEQRHCEGGGTTTAAIPGSAEFATMAVRLRNYSIEQGTHFINFMMSVENALSPAGGGWGWIIARY